MEYARHKDYDKAIYYFQVLAAIDRENTNPADIVYYQFLKMQSQTPASDEKGRIKLAEFAEQNGLDQEALDQYRKLAKSAAVGKLAQGGIDRYATKAFQAAQIQFQSGNYSLAGALADQVRTDFPNSSQVVDRAIELAEKARAEEVKDRRQRRELAKDVVQRADEFYQQAMASYNNIFSTERTSNPMIGTDRSMAQKYFQLAIQAYQEALRIDPSLGTETASLVQVRLNECQDLLQRLSRPGPRGLRNYGRPITQTDAK
jgi:tetratricopeptide (TPR) repeat protein